MYICKIKIKKFRHIENEEIGPLNFNNRTSDLTVLAGPNGSGKSSVLELIGYALSNSYSLNWALSRTFSAFSFEVGIGLSRDEITIIIDSFKKELEPIEQKIEENYKLIDNKTELSEEIKLQQKIQIKENLIRPYKHRYEIIDYFSTNNVYYRAFQFNEGEYAKNSNLYNQIHDSVTNELRNNLKRSLGFFLKADRNYPQKGFDRNKIFIYDGMIKKEYLWTMAYNTSEIQYQDMYDFLVQQRYHYLIELGNYHDKINKGNVPTIRPSDPIAPYQDLLSKIFPEYRFANPNEPIPTNLFVELPSKEILPFNDLSSGEKEVFFILSFFIRHNVENTIIVIDEPDLHLHPELSRLLIRNMKSIRMGNQIWVATHNSEIIDEAGRDKVIYIARDAGTRKAKFVTGDKEQEIILQLKNLFGFSGYIGVAKNLVFLEGDNASPDRKFYSTLFPGESSNFKLIPAKSSANLERLNAAILSIMSANIGWMQFYLIRDKDYLTSDMVDKYRSHSSGKVFVLARHELENYLLDFDIISEVLVEIFNISKSSTEIRSIAHNVALKISSEVVRDMISFRLNLNLKPQDFSIGEVLKGQPYFEAVSGLHSIKAANNSLLNSLFTEASSKISASLSTLLAPSSIAQIVSACENEVKLSLDSDGWLTLFPGKELISGICKALGISNVISFQNSIIKDFASNRNSICPELTIIFNNINAG